ncbi:MAG: hypothetical protein U9N87_12680, partial [Planctomycetota bacterium]|nr:hypothetical protein [Planctomycetota bacterium]
ERYYDYYLDGKPAPNPLPKKKGPKHSATNTVKGWIVRNGTARVEHGVLQVRPAGKKQRPFIANIGLNLPAKLTAVVRLKSTKAGEAGFAWREPGQKRFPANQKAAFDCRGSAELQEHRVALSAQNKIIHVRLHLPATGADVASIELQDSLGKTLKSWRFGK